MDDRRVLGSAGVPPALSRVPRDTSERRKPRLPEKPSGEISEMAQPSPFDVPGGTPGTAGKDAHPTRADQLSCFHFLRPRTLPAEIPRAKRRVEVSAKRLC